MRTTVSLDVEAYRLAQAVASQRRQSLGKVLSEAILLQFRSAPKPKATIIMDEYGFPTLYVGSPITPEEVRAEIEEE